METASRIQLKKVLFCRFDTVNKKNSTWKKLEKLKQFKKASVFNSDFQRMSVDIPNESTTEQIDCYCRGLEK